MTTLTPSQLVAELDKYIVGQNDAKRAVAVAVRNRWRRQQLPEAMRRDVSPKNILMVGPTGVGKTEIARRLALLVRAPFVKVEATKYTEVGYHGRDVESMVRDLLDVGLALVRAEMTEKMKEQADARAEDRLLDLLLAAGERAGGDETDADGEPEAFSGDWEPAREALRPKFRAGAFEETIVDVSFEERPDLSGMLGQAGMEVDPQMHKMLENAFPSRKETRRVVLREARRVLFQQEAEKLFDKDQLTRLAIERVEQQGIIFIDEIDKVTASDRQSGPDVSRQGVQRDLLPIVEGSTVVTRHGPVKTDYILFIAAGAFHQSKPADLMPELQGRFPIRVKLQDLTKEDFVRILTEPQNSLTKQTAALLATEGVEVTFLPEAIEAMAQIAFDVNQRAQNIGARRLYTILEKVFEPLSYEADALTQKKLSITAAYVRDRLSGVLQSEDSSRFDL